MEAESTENISVRADRRRRSCREFHSRSTQKFRRCLLRRDPALPLKSAKFEDSLQMRPRAEQLVRIFVLSVFVRLIPTSRQMHHVQLRSRRHGSRGTATLGEFPYQGTTHPNYVR